MHYYQHNIGDYRRDTVHLSLLEHGVYRQLMDMYYLAESNIPEETELVYRRLCARTEEEKKAVDNVLSEFFKLGEEGWLHPRCDAEIAKYRDKVDRARGNGKLGGRPTKTKEVISGLQEETQTKANLITNKPNNQITKEKTNTIATSSLRPAGVQESTWVDFVKQRKAKKAAITETAIKGIEREARKANMSLDAALQEICARGWTGFKADWVQTDREKKMTHGQASTLAAARAIFGDEREFDAHRTIDITEDAYLLGSEDF